MHPTPNRLLTALRDLGRPAGTAELAAILRLHPNGVRTHLERLRAEGLVLRARERRPRGRPRDLWRAAPGSRSQPYADLGRWLARALLPGGPGVEATGREVGRELAQAREPASLQEGLAALGFEPRALPMAGGAAFELGTCPYREAAREQREVVCALHRGITDGLIDVVAPEARMTRFVPRDPDEAGCLIEIAGPVPA
ncbi:MAG TPA: hypothetical protein VFT42_04795 [Solirubrobacteraceae bacterium]|nr:hypothetical protein [Solirubrobacteraceae bacterium]